MKKIILVSILLIALLTACSSHDTGHQETQEDDKFSGLTCDVIISVLQDDVNSFKEANGSYPTTLEQLVGEYIVAVPKCPGGGVYKVDSNGFVYETH